MISVTIRSLSHGSTWFPVRASRKLASYATYVLTLVKLLGCCAVFETTALEQADAERGFDELTGSVIPVLPHR